MLTRVDLPLTARAAAGNESVAGTRASPVPAAVCYAVSPSRLVRPDHQPVCARPAPGRPSSPGVRRSAFNE